MYKMKYIYHINGQVWTSLRSALVLFLSSMNRTGFEENENLPNQIFFFCLDIF